MMMTIICLPALCTSAFEMKSLYTFLKPKSGAQVRSLSLKVLNNDLSPPQGFFQMAEPFFSDAMSALSCYPDGCVCWLFCLQGSEASPDPEQDYTTGQNHPCPHPPLTGPLCCSPAAMGRLLGKASWRKVSVPVPKQRGNRSLCWLILPALTWRLNWEGSGMLFGLKGESSM